jgi:small subunit ribosomal protein S6
MRRYELMLLFRPDLEDDKLQSAVEKVTRAIVNAGGTLTKVSPWGKRRMAYDIQHFREASYFLLHFDIAPSAIRDIERGLLISEEILRHLVTVLVDHGTSVDEDLPPAAVPAGAQEGYASDSSADFEAAGDEAEDDDAGNGETAGDDIDDAVSAATDDDEEKEEAARPSRPDPVTRRQAP